MTLRTLHAIGSQHGLNHDNLHERAVLGFGVESMSELTTQQMWELAKSIETDYQVWFKATGNRDRASQKQLDYLQDLWIEKSREKTRGSLLTWLKNKREQENKAFPVDGPRWFTRQEMYKVVGILLNTRWKN